MSKPKTVVVRQTLLTAAIEACSLRYDASEDTRLFHVLERLTRELDLWCADSVSRLPKPGYEIAAKELRP